MPNFKRPVSADQVISLIPDSLLDRLSHETGVDYSVQKLHGKIVFKLFLFAFLNQRKISLRILEEIFKSEKFRKLFNIKPKSVKHSALGMRLSMIDYRYFERIFSCLIRSSEIDSVFFADKRILTRKIDSTLVTISSKLVRFGMENKCGGRKSLKFSVELSEGLPVNLLLFTDQASFSEDIALPYLIKQKPNNSKVNIAIFDRGIQKKSTFTYLVDNNIFFISRSDKHAFKIVEDLAVEEAETKTLTVLKDQIVQFSSVKDKDRKITLPQKLRLVSGRSKNTREVISFITNVRFLSAGEVADLYKSRWEIEAFFKFIKQELNFSHLVSRTENGVKVVMYLTMIAAILLTLYKRVNRIIGWAVAKIRFVDELETSIIKKWHYELTGLFVGLKMEEIQDSS